MSFSSSDVRRDRSSKASNTRWASFSTSCQRLSESDARKRRKFLTYPTDRGFRSRSSPVTTSYSMRLWEEGATNRLNRTWEMTCCFLYTVALHPLSLIASTASSEMTDGNNQASGRRSAFTYSGCSTEIKVQLVEPVFSPDPYACPTKARRPMRSVASSRDNTGGGKAALVS